MKVLWKKFKKTIKASYSYITDQPKSAWFFISLAILLVIPIIFWFFDNTYWISVARDVVIYALLALGLNFVVGFAGLLDLGYIVGFEIGAYTAAILSVKGISFLVVLPIAVFITCFIRYILGLPVLRLKGDYLAIVTLGFGEIMRLLAISNEWLTNGPKGLPRVGEVIPDIDFIFFSISSDLGLYILLLVFFVIGIVIAYRLDNSKIGRAWVAIREDEIAAEAIGINVTQQKLLAFVISGIYSAVAGVIYVYWVKYITPELFTVWESITVLLAVVLGGMGSIPGAILGAIMIKGIPEILRELLGSKFTDYRILIFGILIVLIIIFMPQGLFPSERRKLELHPEDRKILLEEEESLFVYRRRK